jgi:ligand-binding SRPBCC domain-containing protein
MSHPRTIRRSSVLDAPADVVWDAVRTPQAFRFVTRGLLDWRPLRGRTEPWRQGDDATGWLLLGGVVPFSRHRIRIAGIDDHERLFRSDESGGVIRSWQHDIRVESLDDGRTRYTDVIHIDAGPITALVAAFAWAFYGERQRRWRMLAPVLAALHRAGGVVEPRVLTQEHQPLDADRARTVLGDDHLG